MKIIIFLSLFSLLILSCKENMTDLQSKNSSIILSNSSNLTLNQILNSYDTTNVIGIIYLINDFQQIKLDYDQTRSFIVDENTATADYDYSINNTKVNNFLLNELNPPSNYYACGGDVINNSGLVLNFGINNNSLLIDSNSYFNRIDTSFSFQTPIRIGNIGFGDTLSINSSFTFTWNSGAGYVFINLFQIDSILNGNTTFNSSYSNAIVANSGSFTITKSDFDQMNTGLYQLELDRVDPRFILTKNNKKIPVIGESKHRITLRLKR